MKNIAITAFQILAVLAVIDIVILGAALAQIALEGRTGEWNPFWATQAKAILWIVGAK